MTMKKWQKEFQKQYLLQQNEKIENILKIIKTCYFNMEIPEGNEQILRQLLKNTIKETNE